MRESIMDDSLTPCQCEFFFNRTYDKEDDTITYTCKINNSVIVLTGSHLPISELSLMDGKVLEAITLYCRERCSHYHDFHTRC